ncbi:hypothetical protein CLAIMM_05707 [Cladophialophora immunda]|nr:hypothetical protein CLAIMM_05707 [Cladophialophora immunda]
MIGTFYSNANQIAVCLCNIAGEDEEWALKVTRFWGDLIQSYSQVLFENLKNILKARPDGNPFKALRRLFEYTLYTRAWAVQETVLGRNTVILYGNHALTIGTLQQLTSHPERMTSLIKEASANSQLDEHTLLRSVGWQCAQGICTARQQTQLHGKVPDIQLLWATRYHRTTYPRDRFYSMYSMLDSNYYPLNYAKRHVEVCREFALSVIQKTNSLDLFSTLSALDPEPHQPSWSSTFLLDPEQDHPLPLLHLELSSGASSGFQAGGVMFNVPPYVDRAKRLHLQGFVLDVIQTVSNAQVTLDVPKSLSQCRQVCSTACNGQVLAPLRAQPGQHIVILIGGKTPYVLGQVRDQAKPSTYKFIGEFYIQHIMHGELLNKIGEGKLYRVGSIVIE